MPNQTEKLLPSASVTKPVRRYDLDWLRVFAVLVLLFYHSARPFVEWGWHIKNEAVSGLITNILQFINIWHMPLFFLLSGSAAWFALSLRPERSFAYEAVLRPYWPNGNQNLINDWANFASYFTIFVYGFVLVSEKNTSCRFSVTETRLQS